ncbi:MAG TPA: prolipoprotein diacylglyceryl transferase family protein [Polyangiaceae bacterium]|jgi:phosphatidylglycerol:prolipoprotein diacylglycerol transferase|nr:prolipoprotein diacylglyceryl transferase family protein [Polyangiaceae bacterium]
MRPVLFEIPLPRLALPLGATLAVLALFAAGVAWFGYRRRAWDLLVVGAFGAVAALVLAFVNRGSTYTPGPLPIMSYGALLAASLAAGWILTLRLAERAGMARDVAAHAYVVTAIAGLVGARLLYVVTNPGEFQSLAEIVALSSGGLTAYGGFLGGFAGAWWSLRRLGAPFLLWADAAVPSVALGLALTRVGCYLHGCDFGRPLSEQNASLLRKLGTFPRWADGVLAGSGSPAWVDHVLRKGLSPAAPSSLPVHPTQLYEALVGVGLFALSLFWFPRRRFAGELFLIVVFAYGGARFMLELFRDDAERGLFGPALPGLLWVALGLLVAGASVVVLGLSRSRRGVTAVVVVAFWGLGLWLARFTAFGREAAIALSSAQWLGLFTMLAVAYYGWRESRIPASELTR